MWHRRSRAASLGGGAGAALAAPSDAGARVLGTRAARFGEVPNGTRVRIYGIAGEAAGLLASPIMERACVAYRLVVEEPGWHTVLDQAAGVPFVVQDGDVSVGVRGPFRVYLQVDFEWDFDNDVQRRIARLLHLHDEGALQRPSPPSSRPARRSSPMTDEIYCQNYRYFEALVRPGDRVTVEGFASVTVDPAGTRDGLRAPPLLYTLSGTPERPAIVAVPERGSVAP